MSTFEDKLAGMRAQFGLAGASGPGAAKGPTAPAATVAPSPSAHTFEGKSQSLRQRLGLPAQGAPAVSTEAYPQANYEQTMRDAIPLDSAPPQTPDTQVNFAPMDEHQISGLAPDAIHPAAIVKEYDFATAGAEVGPVQTWRDVEREKAIRKYMPSQTPEGQAATQAAAEKATQEYQTRLQETKADPSRLATAIVEGRIRPRDLTDITPDKLDWNAIAGATYQSQFTGSPTPGTGDIRQIAEQAKGDPTTAHQNLMNLLQSREEGKPFQFLRGVREGGTEALTFGYVPPDTLPETGAEKAGSVTGSILGSLPALAVAGGVGGAPAEALATRFIPTALEGSELAGNVARIAKGVGTGLALQGAREGAAYARTGEVAPGIGQRLGHEAAFFGILDAVSPYLGAAAGKGAGRVLPAAIRDTTFAHAIEGGVGGAVSGGTTSLLVNSLFPSDSEQDKSVWSRVLNDAVTIGLFGAVHGAMGSTETGFKTQPQQEIIGQQIGGRIYRGIPEAELAAAQQAKGDLSQLGYTEFKPNSGVWQKRGPDGTLIGEIHEDVIVNGRQVPKIVADRAARFNRSAPETTPAEPQAPGALSAPPPVIAPEQAQAQAQHILASAGGDRSLALGMLEEYQRNTNDPTVANMAGAIAEVIRGSAPVATPQAAPAAAPLPVPIPKATAKGPKPKAQPQTPVAQPATQPVTQTATDVRVAQLKAALPDVNEAAITRIVENSQDLNDQGFAELFTRITGQQSPDSAPAAPVAAAPATATAAVPPSPPPVAAPAPVTATTPPAQAPITPTTEPARVPEQPRPSQTTPPATPPPVAAAPASDLEQARQRVVSAGNAINAVLDPAMQQVYGAAPESGGQRAVAIGKFTTHVMNGGEVSSRALQQAIKVPQNAANALNNAYHSSQALRDAITERRDAVAALRPQETQPTAGKSRGALQQLVQGVERYTRKAVDKYAEADILAKIPSRLRFETEMPLTAESVLKVVRQQLEASVPGVANMGAETISNLTKGLDVEAILTEAKAWRARDASRDAEATRQEAPAPVTDATQSTAKSLPMMNDNHIKPLSTYTGTLYRETSARAAFPFIKESKSTDHGAMNEVYLANTPNLALGQGDNQGILLEFDAGALRGQVNTAKPAWQMAYDQGEAELIGKNNGAGAYQEALRSVTVKPDAKLPKVDKARLTFTLKALETNGWTKTENADGSVVYRRPEAATAAAPTGEAVRVPSRHLPAKAQAFGDTVAVGQTVGLPRPGKFEVVEATDKSMVKVREVGKTDASVFLVGRKALKPLETAQGQEPLSAREQLRQKTEQTLGREGLVDERGSFNMSGGPVRPNAQGTPQQYTFGDAATEERFQASKGITPPSMWDKLRETMTTLKNQSTREWEHLPRTGEFAQLRFSLNRLKQGKAIAGDQTIRHMQGLTVKFTPAKYDLFSRKVVLDDIMADVEIAQDKGETPRLAFGFTPESAKKAHAEVSALVAKDPDVSAAVTERQALVKEIVDEYMNAADVAVGYRPPLNRRDYFRHQVLAYQNLTATQGAGQKLKAPTARGFTKAREGSELDYNTEYRQAEFEWMAQMLYDTRVFDLLKMVKDKHDIAPRLKAEAKAAGENWQQNLPDGYVLWQPREGNMAFQAYSLPEKAIRQAMDQALLQNVEYMEVFPEDLRKVMVMGARRPEIVIPENVAKTLDEIGRVAHSGVVDQAVRKTVSAWKHWQLLSPMRVLKYNLNNLSGDVDAAVFNAGAFKRVPKATGDLYNFLIRKAAPTPELDAWLARGGLEVNQQVAEGIHNLNGLEVFWNLADTKAKGLGTTVAELPKTIWQGYWKTARMGSDFREALLRYANFLEYGDQIKANGGRPKNFGASLREEVMALADPHDQAFKLSNDLMGAYDEVTVTGQWMRERLAPFWSFQEVNARRYYRLMRNVWEDSGAMVGVGKTAAFTMAKVAIKSPLIAMRIGKFVVGANLLVAALAAWNYLMFRDDEENLSKDVRSRPHLILGHDSKGKPQYATVSGSWYDFISWFGLDKTPIATQDFLSGRKSIKEIVIDMAKAPVNKLAGSIGGLTKSVAEAIIGRTTFPDIFNTRPVRDRWEQLFSSVGMRDEYKALTGKPMEGAPGDSGGMRYLRTWPKKLVAQSDPLETAYYDIRDQKYKFLEAKGKGGGSGGDYTARSNALYYFKLAMRYNDEEAAKKYLTEYATLGGTKTGIKDSIATMDPLSGMSKENHKAFIDSLDSPQRATLKDATEFYDKVLKGGDYQNRTEYRKLPLK